MVLKFQQEVDGIPLEVAVKQLDGTNKIVSLFISTDAESIADLMDKTDSIKAKAEELKVKYPALNKPIDDEDVEGFREVIKGATELVKANYDELFGEGTYDELSESGLGLLKLIPLLTDLTDGLTEELESKFAENQKKSDKRKADLLIKNKKKQK